jgi:AcrR family transcriptional regulator
MSTRRNVQTGLSKSSASTALDPGGPRERILSVAGALFYREGYRAVGIDRIIADADVAKATFYNHFPSKDDLIVAWIQGAEKSSQQHLPPATGTHPLFDYVDALLAIAKQSWCMGCTYQVTAAEFVDRDHPAHAASMAVKQRVLAELKARAKQQGVKHPQAVAEKLFLLLEGVWASVRMFHSDAPLVHAKAAARQLAAD